MEIKYQVIGQLCVTKCYMFKDRMVGSGACDRCEYSSTKHTQGLRGVVECNFPEANNED